MRKLVIRAQNGDADAFVALVEANRQKLYRTALCYLKNTEDVADVIQDTILTAFEKIRELKEPAYFSTWLVRILINRCQDMLRRKNREIVSEEVPEESHSDHVLEQMIVRELLQKVEEPYREILILHYVQGLSGKEIAKVMEMKAATVRTRLRRGRMRLKTLYEMNGKEGKEDEG